MACADGVRLTGRVRDALMWEAMVAEMTRSDQPADEDEPKRSPAGVFDVLALILATAGWRIAQTARQFVARYRLSSTLVGSPTTAVVTILARAGDDGRCRGPECAAACRRRHHRREQCASLFVSASDVTCREGSPFHALGPHVFWLAIGLSTTAVLLDA